MVVGINATHDAMATIIGAEKGRIFAPRACWTTVFSCMPKTFASRNADSFNLDTAGLVLFGVVHNQSIVQGGIVVKQKYQKSTDALRYPVSPGPRDKWLVGLQAIAVDEVFADVATVIAVDLTLDIAQGQLAGNDDIAAGHGVVVRASLGYVVVSREDTKRLTGVLRLHGQSIVQASIVVKQILGVRNVFRRCIKSFTVQKASHINHLSENQGFSAPRSGNLLRMLTLILLAFLLGTQRASPLDMNKRYTLEVKGLVLWGGKTTLAVAQALARQQAQAYGVMVDLYAHTSTRSEWLGGFGPFGETAIPVTL